MVEALVDPSDVDVHATLFGLACDIPEDSPTNECEVALYQTATVEAVRTHWREAGELFYLSDPDAWGPVPSDPLAGVTLTAGERQPTTAPT